MMEAAAPFALASVTMAAAAAKKVEAGFRRLPFLKLLIENVWQRKLQKSHF